MCDDEKRIGVDKACHSDIVSQVEERYVYQHRSPPEVKVYVDSIADCAASERPAAQRVAKPKQKERKQRQPEAKT